MEQCATSRALFPFAECAHPMGGALALQYRSSFAIALLALESFVPLAFTKIFLAINIGFEGFGKLNPLNSIISIFDIKLIK